MSNKEIINEDLNEEVLDGTDSGDIWKDAFDAARILENKKRDKDDEEIQPSAEELSDEEVNDIEENRENESVAGKQEYRQEKSGVSSGEESLLKEIETLKLKIEDKEIQLKRLAADFDNYRRRQDIEKEDLLKYGSEKTILELLPVLDNFERAIESSKNTTDVGSIISGIEMIQKQFTESLKRQGVEIIEAIDKPFDPNFHEAVQQMVNNDKPDQTVIHEIRKGYSLNGRIIRPSMVVVSTISDD